MGRSYRTPEQEAAQIQFWADQAAMRRDWEAGVGQCRGCFHKATDHNERGCNVTRGSSCKCNKTRGVE